MSAMQARWESVHLMEQFVARAASMGIDDHDLQLARLAIDLARIQPPSDGEASIELWHQVRAHGDVLRIGGDSFATYIAAMCCREAQVSTGRTVRRTRRRWWRNDPLSVQLVRW